MTNSTSPSSGAVPRDRARRRHVVQLEPERLSRRAIEARGARERRAEWQRRTSASRNAAAASMPR